MEIFFRLLLGHLLADFTFQTNYIAAWKRNSRVGLLTHVVMHPLCYIPLLWPYLNETWVVIGGLSFNGWGSIAIATVLHLLEDWFRVDMVNRGWPDNILFYSWDQAVHLVVLFIFSPIRTHPLVNQWPLLGIFFVIVTHFATVTVYFIEKGLYGGEYPETEEKYVSILQRLVVWMAFFLPYPWWILVLAFILISFGRHVLTRRIDFSVTSVLLGNGIAIACGIMTRFVLNRHLL